jgi:hypothetical protein
MSYVTIGQAICDLLGEITSLKQVNNYAETNLVKYPTANVRMRGHNNNFASIGGSNNRVYSFLIDVFYKSENASDAESILRSVTDDIIAKIEGNVKLKGSCDFAMPTSGDVQYTEAQIPVQYITIRIDAKKMVSR